MNYTTESASNTNDFVKYERKAKKIASAAIAIPPIKEFLFIFFRTPLIKLGVNLVLMLDASSPRFMSSHVGMTDVKTSEDFCIFECLVLVPIFKLNSSLCL